MRKIKYKWQRLEEKNSLENYIIFERSTKKMKLRLRNTQKNYIMKKIKLLKNIKIMKQQELNEIMFWGLSLIGMFIPVVIFCAVVLYSMYKDGTSYGRKIPIPPPHLNPNFKKKT